MQMGYFSRYSDKARLWKTKKLGFDFWPLGMYQNNSYLLKISYLGFLLKVLRHTEILVKIEHKNHKHFKCKRTFVYDACQ
jgi:hypothetical protein